MDEGNQPFRGQIIPDGLAAVARLLLNAAVTDSEPGRQAFLIQAREAMATFKEDLAAESENYPRAALVKNYHRLTETVEEAMTVLGTKDLGEEKRLGVFTTMDRLISVADNPTLYEKAARSAYSTPAITRGGSFTDRIRRGTANEGTGQKPSHSALR